MKEDILPMSANFVGFGIVFNGKLAEKNQIWLIFSTDICRKIRRA